MDSLSVALNDLRFNYRMWKRRERRFISDKLLDLDLKELEEAFEDNKRAFSMGKDITITSKVNDKFVTQKVSSSDSNYMIMYNLQSNRFKKWIEVCKTIKDFVKSNDNEVDALMDEVYENVALSYEKEKAKDSSDVDSIVNSLLEKASKFEKMIKGDEAQVNTITKEEKPRVNAITKEDKLQVNAITIRRAKRLYDTVGEVNHYYDKLEKLRDNDDILGFYEENSEYIEEDLVLDIDYLSKKLAEYKSLYGERKPFVFSRDGENVNVFSSDLGDEYDMSYSYICSHIEIAIEKAKVIKDKNFVHDYVVEPVYDHSMEMIFNEFLDTSMEISKLIESGDNFNNYMMITWTDASGKILNNLKDKLIEDYNNGNKIKVSKFENGRYVVTEEENTLENYEMQLKFLDDCINKCSNLKARISDNIKALPASTDIVKEDNVKALPASDTVKSDITSKYVVVLNNDTITVISSELGDADLLSINSKLLDEATDKGLDIHYEVNLPSGVGVQYVGGIMFEIKDDGTIVIGSKVDKAEFHNQEELILTYNDVKNVDITEKLVNSMKNNDKDGIKKMFSEVDPSEIWSKLNSDVNAGVIKSFEADDLVDYITDSFDDDELNKIISCDEYKALKNKLDLEKTLPRETDVTKVKNPYDDARKVVKREKKMSLIEKFKGLKRWQKTAIVAGLALAGVAVVGVGVYHLVPEVRPMIDSFIQNLHASNFGGPANDAIAQVSKPSDVITQNAQSVDYSSFGAGHRVFSDAYSAASSVNPMEASVWFNGNPLDVFNIDTNEFMHLTREQLHDPEFLKTLASDPSNTMLFGADMANPDGFMPLSDIVGEMVKGGKIL